MRAKLLTSIHCAVAILTVSEQYHMSSKCVRQLHYISVLKNFDKQCFTCRIAQFFNFIHYLVFKTEHVSKVDLFMFSLDQNEYITSPIPTLSPGLKSMQFLKLTMSRNKHSKCWDNVLQISLLFLVYYNCRYVVTLLLKVFSQTFSVSGTARCVFGFLDSDSFILGSYMYSSQYFIQGTS